MQQLGIRTTDGIRYVSPARLAELVAAGKVPPDRRIVTVDRGASWVTAAEALGASVHPPVAGSAPSAPPPRPVAPAGPQGVPGLVVASFVLSGLSAILLCFTGIPAIVCAALAMRKPGARLAGLALGIAIAMTVVPTVGWGIVSRLNPELLDQPGGAASASGARAARPGEPESQRQFVRIVSASSDEYRSARNEIAEAASRDARRRALASAFPSASVTGWVGRIREISTNMDGKGVLSVTIGSDVVICTWNNALSDLGSGTLIEKSSPVYEALMKLQAGDKVVVSGRFLPSDEDHFAEQSLTLEGSMVDPAFTFDFRSVEPAE